MIEKEVTNINIFGGPRTGGNYLALSLQKLLEVNNPSLPPAMFYGEVFNLKGKNRLPFFKGTYEERYIQYEEFLSSNEPAVFKIFGRDLKPKKPSVNREWLTEVPKFTTQPGVKNILLYREDVLDSILSAIIYQTIGFNHTYDEDFYNTIPTLYPEDSRIKKTTKSMVDNTNRIVQLYKHFKFDAVIKYESLSGNFIEDFGSNLPTEKKLKYSEEFIGPHKMHSREHKESILPMDVVNSMFEETIKEIPCPRFLDFQNDNIKDIPFLQLK